MSAGNGFLSDKLATHDAALVRIVAARAPQQLRARLLTLYSARRALAGLAPQAQIEFVHAGSSWGNTPMALGELAIVFLTTIAGHLYEAAWRRLFTVLDRGAIHPADHARSPAQVYFPAVQVVPPFVGAVQAGLSAQALRRPGLVQGKRLPGFYNIRIPPVTKPNKRLPSPVIQQVSFNPGGLVRARRPFQACQEPIRFPLQRREGIFFPDKDG